MHCSILTRYSLCGRLSHQMLGSHALRISPPPLSTQHWPAPAHLIQGRVQERAVPPAFAVHLHEVILACIYTDLYLRVENR